MSSAMPHKTIVAIEDRRSDIVEVGPATGSMNSQDLGRRMLDVQNLLFGDAQRLMEDRLDHTDDRHREAVEAFDERLRLMADTYERRITALQEEMYKRDREQTAMRRRLVLNIGEAIKDMAEDA